MLQRRTLNNKSSIDSKNSSQVNPPVYNYENSIFARQLNQRNINSNTSNSYSNNSNNNTNAYTYMQYAYPYNTNNFNNDTSNGNNMNYGNDNNDNKQYYNMSYISSINNTNQNINNTTTTNNNGNSPSYYKNSYKKYSSNNNNGYRFSTNSVTTYNNYNENTMIDTEDNKQITKIKDQVNLFNRYFNVPVDLENYKDNEGKLKPIVILNNHNHNNNNNNRRRNNNNNNNHSNRNNKIIIKLQSPLDNNNNKSYETINNITSKYFKNETSHKNKPLLHLAGSQDFPINSFNDLMYYKDLEQSETFKTNSTAEILYRFIKNKEFKDDNHTTNTKLTPNMLNKSKNIQRELIDKKFNSKNNLMKERKIENINHNNISNFNTSVQFNESFELSFDGKAMDRSDIFRMVDSFSVAFDDDDDEDIGSSSFRFSSAMPKNILPAEITNNAY